MPRPPLRRHPPAEPEPVGAPPGRTLELTRAQAAARRHRVAITVMVIATSIAVSVALAAIAGLRRTTHHLEHLRWWYVAALLAAHAIAYAGYRLAHHRVIDRSVSTPIDRFWAKRMVAVGFGAWGVAGGFAVDRRGLSFLGATRTEATVAAVALGALELAVLTPVAWICSLVLLGSPRVPLSETVPWAVLFPILFGLAVATGARARRAPRDAGERRWTAELRDGLGVAFTLFRHPRDGGAAIGGVAVYWAADIAALWAALQLLAVSISLPRLILGYATGYVLSRRTLPFAGVVVTEVLMTVALVWVDVPLAAAVPAVLAYRLSDFALTLGSALGADAAAERFITVAVESR